MQNCVSYKPYKEFFEMAEWIIEKKTPLRVLTKIVPLVPNSMTSYIEPVQPLL